MYKVTILATALLGVVLSAPVNPGAKAPDVKEGTDPMNVSFWSFCSIRSVQLLLFNEDRLTFTESEQLMKSESCSSYLLFFGNLIARFSLFVQDLIC